MKTKFILLILLIFFCQSLFAQRGVGNQTVTKLPTKEKRWALIIGVGQYEDGNITALPGANNDARALRDALRDYAGFDEKQIITLTTDESKDRQPTKNNILRYLGNLSGTVPKDGLLLVAFSGHGIERAKRAFLLASDTPYNENVKVLERTAISVADDFKELVRDTGVGQVIILLDACRNDPSSGRSSSDNPLTEAYKDGFSFDIRNREVEAFATLYATSIGERAYEYTRENKGYFTWAFIEGLKGGAANEAGEVTLGNLIRYVERYVPQQVKLDLGGGKIQKPFSEIEGYAANELVLGIGKKFSQITSSPVIIKNSEPDNTELIRFQDANEKYGFKNKRSRVVSIAPQYDYASDFHEGLATVMKNRKFGFIDPTGKIVVALKYDDANSFYEGLSNVRLGNKQGFIDKTGNVVIPIKYSVVSVRFKEGLAYADLNGKVGFIDTTDRAIIPFGKYDSMRLFGEGLAPVRFKGKWGFIDKTDKLVIEFKYDDAFSFEGGKALVHFKNREFYIDKNGNEIE